MQNNTPISLGSYFDHFVQMQVARGRYKNANEVIRAGLRLLEEDEARIMALKNAIEEGIESGIATDFNPQQHLKTLKANKANG